MQRHTKICLFTLVLLLLSAGLALGASPNVEQSSFGKTYAIRPQFFGSGSGSGTYYQVSAVPHGSLLFVTIQGGQFSPVPYRGDQIRLFTTPNSLAGMTQPFTDRGRLSYGLSTASQVVHWSAGNLFKNPTTGQFALVAELSEPGASGQGGGKALWLWEGSPTGGGNDLAGSWRRLMEIDPSSGVGRFSTVVLAPDTTRTPPADGFTHTLLRGFVKMSFASLVEIRIDISNAYSALPTQVVQGALPDDPTIRNITVPGVPAKIEVRKNGAWTLVANNILTFSPSPVRFDFRPSSLVTVDGQLELWGSWVQSRGSTCGTCDTTLDSQLGFFILNPSTWTVPTKGQQHAPNRLVYSQIRCAPHGHTEMRYSGQPVEIGTATYLLSDENDDDCATYPTNPFIGFDVVVTELQ